jgi:hypothetical protein
MFRLVPRVRAREGVNGPTMRCHSVALWYGEPDAITNAIGYAKFRSRSHHAVIRVYDQAGNVIGRVDVLNIPPSAVPDFGLVVDRNRRPDRARRIRHGTRRN